MRYDQRPGSPAGRACAGPLALWSAASGDRLVATIIAMGVRNFLTPWLGTGLPFITAFPAVAIVAFFSGITTGAMTAIACVLWLFAPWSASALVSDSGGKRSLHFFRPTFLVAFFSGQGRDEAAAATAAAAETASAASHGPLASLVDADGGHLADTAVHGGRWDLLRTGV